MSWEVEVEMPRLVIESPICSHCGEGVQMDDGVAWCEGCRVEWSRIEDGWLSVPDPDREGTDVACEIIPRRIRGDNFDIVHGGCILPSGHEGEHAAPFSRAGHQSTEEGADHG